MHKSKKWVQTVFMMKVTKKDCEIIALQELWQNTYMNIIHCLSSSDFWSAYFKQFQSKACFLVCKIFSLFFWSVKYSALNIVSLIMQINDQTIHIHNIYSKSLNNYTHINQNSLIFRLSELLKKSDKHVLLEDFNLHHLIWDDSQCFIRHNMMNELLHIINETEILICSHWHVIKEHYQCYKLDE